MKQFKTLNLFWVLFCALFCLTACFDDKDLYDPNRENENPLESMDVPADFDWKTMASMNVKVAVSEFEGNYSHLVEVFNANPVLEPDSKAITAGYATSRLSFASTVTVPKGVDYVYIRQTSPDGLSSVRSVAVEDGKNVVCDFSKSTPAPSTRAMAMTRSGSANIEAPTLPDIDPNNTSLFPATVPDNATLLTNSWTAGTSTAWKNIILNKSTPALSSSNAGQYLSFYIVEDMSLSSINAMANRNIYIMPGVTLTIKGDLSMGQSNWYVSVGQNAQLIVEGELKPQHTNRLYNLGTLTAKTMNTVGTSVIYNTGNITVTTSTQLEYNFYNVGGTFTTPTLYVDQEKVETLYNSGIIKITKGSGEVFTTGNKMLLYNTNTIEINGDWKATGAAVLYNKDKISVTGSILLNTGTNRFVNDADIECGNFSSTGSASTVNYGVMTVSGNSDIKSKDEWTNHGTWITETMETISYGAKYLNSCRLIVNDKLTFKQARFVNDAGSFIKTKDMHVENTRIEMYDESFIHVTGTTFVKGSRIKESEGVYGMGSNQRSLLRMVKVVADAADSQHIYYSGNLQVACSDHPGQYQNGSNAIWVMTDGAEWAADTNNTVKIPATECNDGWNTDPKPPVEPTIDPVVDPYTYTYLFEDQWPFYGDYDMNDVVVSVNNITTYINSNNKAEKFSFDASIRAVGAEKVIAGAVMLDHILASQVQAVSYSSHAPTTFTVNNAGVEENQTQAVMPLFDHVHRFMGRESGFINTLKGSANNVTTPPTVTVTVEFVNPVDMADLNVKYLNFFIITDINIRPVTVNPRREIHLVDYKPTAVGETSIFGNNNDGSSISGGKYYRSKDNLPWGIVVPDEFKWPLEYVKIQTAYTEFEDWVLGNSENPQWWKSPESGLVY